MENSNFITKCYVSSGKYFLICGLINCRLEKKGIWFSQVLPAVTNDFLDIYSRRIMNRWIPGNIVLIAGDWFRDNFTMPSIFCVYLLVSRLDANVFETQDIKTQPQINHNMNSLTFSSSSFSIYRSIIFHLPIIYLFHLLRDKFWRILILLPNAMSHQENTFWFVD